jgi:DNA-binding beta-propeller fold protein YncE
MSHPKLVTLLALVPSVFACPAAFAQLLQLPNYQKISTIQIPGNLAGGFDITWVDSANQKLYLSDRGTTKGGGKIDVIDTSTNQYLYSIPQTKGEIGFAGSTGNRLTGGPNGVVAIPQLSEVWAGDGDSTVKVVDLAAKAIVATIPTGGKSRADELAYDPLDRIVMVANDADTPPFLTFISTDSLAVLGHLSYGTDQVGLEQPVWDPQTKRFLISVPASEGRFGRVDEINPVTMQISNQYTVECDPAGLALGPLQRVMTSCGYAINGRNGNILANVNANIFDTNTIGGDEIWFNPGDNRYYFGGANVGVVDAETNQPLGFLATGVPTHSLAADSSTNHIYVPATGIGMEVFAQTP